MPTHSAVSRESDLAIEEAEVVELHWMKTPDIAMYEQHGVAVPALCGAWMEPDEELAEAVTGGAVARVRYEACGVCDVLHARNQALEPGVEPRAG